MADILPLPPKCDSLFDSIQNQYGAISAGHYVSYAKNARNQRWYLYNDSRCKVKT